MEGGGVRRGERVQGERGEGQGVGGSVPGRPSVRAARRTLSASPTCAPMPTNNPLPPVVASVCLSTLIVSLGMFLTKAIWERHLITSHGQSTKAVKKPVILPVTNDSYTGTRDSVSDFVAA